MDEISVWTRLLDFSEALAPGIIAIVTSGAISGGFAAMTSVHRRYPKKWWGGLLQKLTTSPGRMHVIWTIMLLGVLYACWQAFDSVNVRNYQLKDEIDRLYKPDFSFSVQTAIIGNNPPDGMHVVLQSTLTNSGASAAVLSSSWKLKVELVNGKILDGDASTITTPIHLCNENGTQHITFEKGDQLSLRADTPIERMGYREGVLAFVIRGLAFEEFLQQARHLNIFVSDVKKQYNFVVSMDELKRKIGLSIFMPSYSHPRMETGCPKQ